jgi:hypothetical protein
VTRSIIQMTSLAIKMYNLLPNFLYSSPSLIYCSLRRKKIVTIPVCVCASPWTTDISSRYSLFLPFLFIISYLAFSSGFFNRSSRIDATERRRRRNYRSQQQSSDQLLRKTLFRQRALLSRYRLR